MNIRRAAPISYSLTDKPREARQSFTMDTNVVTSNAVCHN